ncbi:MATE family efflux transporter [Cellulomonas sp. S1-8]|uniref:MATE family efflux transporter n=1 Tax=Cellulomonas sp. S1-8 TaxID=2904790 RepID=UPI002243C539|nr:MATE family efflux transporter [Cellulomonas sp. S1-8]UZN03114.1 MATE family efflux transporter [Cellulomonas sp. S1-8]
MSKVLTVGSPWRVIATFAVPLLIGNVVQQLYHFADAIVVGRVLGVESLAAVGATGSLLFLLIGFAWGTTSGFAIPTAQAFGAGDHAAVRRSVATGALLTAVITLVLTVGAPLLAEPALRLLRTPEELLPEATTFAVISFLGAATTMFFNFLASIIRAIGDSRTPLVFLTVSCVLNIGLVVTLVGVLGTGVGGAALATVASQGTAVALCLLYVWRRVPVLHVRREDWRVSRADLARHLHLGLPMGFQASIIAIGALAVQVRLNSLGADAVAAYTTAARVDLLAVTLLASLGLAMSMFVAQNLGGGRPDRIRAGVVQGVWMAVGASVVLGAVLVAAGSHLVGLFVGEGEQRVVDLAAYLLLVNGALYVVLGVLMVLRGALQGLGQTLVPTVTGLVELVMRVGAAIVLGAAYGFEGVVWGNPLAWLGAVALLIPAYLRAHRRLALEPVAPLARVEATPEPVVLEGPSDGSMVVDAVVPQPRHGAGDRDEDHVGRHELRERVPG